MVFAPTEGAEVDSFVFVGTGMSAVASEIPADTYDVVVGAEEIAVAVLCPYQLAVTFEFDGCSAVCVLGCVVTSLGTDEAVGR